MLTNVKKAFTNEIIALVQRTKQRMAVAVNAELTLAYWTKNQQIYCAELMC